MWIPPLVFGCEVQNRTGLKGYEPPVLPSHSLAVLIIEHSFSNPRRVHQHINLYLVFVIVLGFFLRNVRSVHAVLTGFTFGVPRTNPEVLPAMHACCHSIGSFCSYPDNTGVIYCCYYYYIIVSPGY